MRNEPIVKQKARPKGEKQRGSWPLLLFVGVILSLLIIIPFMILRPRADIYLLRTFETAPVERGTLIEYVCAPGTLVPRIERSLVTPSEGTLLEWLVAEGDEVTQGKALGRFASPSLEREVATQQEAVLEAERRIQTLQIEAEAASRQQTRAIEGAHLALTEAQRVLETRQQLFDIGANSRQELEAAAEAVRQAELNILDIQADAKIAEERSALSMAGAQAVLRQAQQALTLSEAQLSALELTAPVAGQVIRLNARAGDRVTSQTLLATVASASDLQVIASLDESQAQRVSVGQVANIRAANTTYRGVVMRVSPQAEVGANGTAVVPAVVVFEQTPPKLRVGVSANVEIEVGRISDALYLPRGPYLTTGGERLAFVVKSNTATRQIVTFGLIDGNRVEVRNGLAEGQRIITSSYEAFRDRVEIQLAPTGEIR